MPIRVFGRLRTPGRDGPQRRGLAGSRARLALAASSAALLLAGYLSAIVLPALSEGEGIGKPTGLMTFQDTPWAASTGFLSIPSVRALLARPRWDGPPPDPAGRSGASLAIVGLPIDLDHAMLQGTQADTLCIARQSATEQSVALCGRKSGDYTLLKTSDEYDLCAFTDDCWHSTAAAVLAAGAAIDPKLFSFESIAAVAYKDGTREPPTADAADPDPGDKPADAPADPDASKDDDAPPIVLPVVPAIYQSASAVPGLVLDPREAPSQDAETRQIIREHRDYAKLPPAAFPLVELYRGEPNWAGALGNRSLANRNIILTAGRRPGGSLYAINVFSRVESDQICQAVRRKAPCVLTNLAAQETALRNLLATAEKEAAASSSGAAAARSRLGAVLIIAGGALTDRPCDDTPTAQVIAKLRALGVHTFVPAGNDGEATKVRFPGCASAAVTVGSLDRNGQVAAYSNGRSTPMVKLYTDGDSLVLPIRALPFPGLACMLPEKLAEIVRQYQTVLKGLGHYAGEPSGMLDPRTEEAVRRFQTRESRLEQTGRLNAATLQALERQAERLRRRQPDLEVTPIAANVSSSRFSDLSTYQDYLCKDGKREAFYQAQFVSGTLVSASVAAGLFLRLGDETPGLTSQAALEAVAASAAGKPNREFVIRDVMDAIARQAKGRRNAI